MCSVSFIRVFHELFEGPVMYTHTYVCVCVLLDPATDFLRYGRFGNDHVFKSASGDSDNQLNLEIASWKMGHRCDSIHDFPPNSIC